MNYSLSIFLIRQDVRCVAGIYEAKVDGQPEPKRGLFKTLDPSIQVGDFVPVPTTTRHRMTVNQIVAVDLDVDFTPRSRWTGLSRKSTGRTGARRR